MTDSNAAAQPARQERWLKHYYFVRTAFSTVWVVLAISVGQHSPGVAAALLVVYPAWDALANYIDMSRSGGLNGNRTQAVNVAISLTAAVAVTVALSVSQVYVLEVVGAWAFLSGLLQFGTAVRRWKNFGAQWAMILSGAQSALAGIFFIIRANGPVPAAIVKVADYATVGAIYFLVSATWLSAKDLRRKIA